MVKVKLRETKRLFESEDADFIIQAKEEKELHTRVLRSYHIKNYLLNGHLKLTEGELLIAVKHSKILFSAKHPDKAYGLEFGKFFIRDLDLWTISWESEEHNISETIKEKLEGKSQLESKVEKDEIIDTSEISEVSLKKMTKDEINDLASEMGFSEEITANDKKAIMIEKLLILLGLVEEETDKETDKETDEETEKETDEETDEETEKETDEETDEETEK